MRLGYQQAAPIICRHTLDVLISLAKSFPSHFLPRPSMPSSSSGAGASATALLPAGGSSASSSSTASRSAAATDFWDLLVRLDSQSASRKGKVTPGWCFLHVDDFYVFLAALDLDYLICKKLIWFVQDNSACSMML